MFSLAPYRSLPELVLVRMYTFLVNIDPSAKPKKHGVHIHITHPHHPPS
jgi:hypothetical protein